MSGRLARLRDTLFSPPAPLTAVEVRPRGIGVVRLTRQGNALALAAAAAQELPEGVLMPSMTQTNIADPDAFRRVLGAVLERAGALSAGRVALVLPDPVARIALVPAAEARAARHGETEELLRYRLRKSVPFEIRQTRLAWSSGEPEWLVAAIYQPVLDEYESACRSFGLQPGLVELSGLALFEGGARGAGDTTDRMLVNWDDGYVSFVLGRSGRAVLVRTLAGPGASDPESVAREAAQTVLYYRDRLQGAGLPNVQVRAAAQMAGDAASVLAEPLGMAPQLVDPLAPLGAATPGVPAQALAGAAASLLGRAA
jgi:hypothetical protein